MIMQQSEHHLHNKNNTTQQSKHGVKKEEKMWCEETNTDILALLMDLSSQTWKGTSGRDVIRGGGWGFPPATFIGK